MRWHARIGHDRIYIDVTIYDDAMLFNFAPMATEYRPKSPTAWDAADFFRLLPNSFHLRHFGQKVAEIW